MQKVAYNWDANGASAIINPHSIAKHEVLRDYLIRYVKVFARNPRYNQLRILLVDGFAGGGIYKRWDNKKEYEGSPLIMMRAMQDAADLINLNPERTKKLIVKPSFIFVERDHDGFQSLNRVIAESDVPFRDEVTFIHGSFTEKLREILNNIKQSEHERAIFLLDQYGYSDVPMPVIRNIFQSLPKAEVLLTFAIDALSNFVPKIHKNQVILKKIGLEKHLSNNTYPQEYNQRKKQIESDLSLGIHAESGAKFYTPFFIRSSQSTRGYWFIHLSNHLRARDVMVRLHWEKHTHFVHQGGPGLDMLAYDPKYDPKVTKQPDLFLFDDPARSRSIEKLNEDIPKFIFDEVGSQGITLENFLHQKFNDTPAHVDMIKSVIGESVRSKNMLVIGPNRVFRKGGEQWKAISLQDVISPNPQLQLQF